MDKFATLRKSSLQLIALSKGRIGYFQPPKSFDESEVFSLSRKLAEPDLQVLVIDFRNITHIDIESLLEMESQFGAAIASGRNVIFSGVSTKLNQTFMEIFKLDKIERLFMLDNADIAINFAAHLISRDVDDGEPESVVIDFPTKG